MVNAAAHVATAALQAGAGAALGPLLAAMHAVQAAESDWGEVTGTCIDRALAVDAQVLHGRQHKHHSGGCMLVLVWD